MNKTFKEGSNTLYKLGKNFLKLSNVLWLGIKIVPIRSLSFNKSFSRFAKRNYIRSSLL